MLLSYGEAPHEWGCGGGSVGTVIAKSWPIYKEPRVRVGIEACSCAGTAGGGCSDISGK